MNELAIWTDREIENEDNSWQCGPLQATFRTVENELWVAFSESAVQTDPDWQRWALKKPPEKLQFLPCFPDLPVVVKPETTFRLMPNITTRIYVRVPLWVRLMINNEALIEQPIIPLGKTWFGDFLSGTLCYWITSAIRPVITADPARPYLAICPIEITNRSDEELLVEKISLHVDGLSLFESEGQLWSNLMKIRYRGTKQVSEIKVDSKPDRKQKNLQLITPARENSGRGFSAKTFASLKEIPGIEFFWRQT